VIEMLECVSVTVLHAPECNLEELEELEDQDMEHREAQQVAVPVDLPQVQVQVGSVQAGLAANLTRRVCMGRIAVVLLPMVPRPREQHQGALKLCIRKEI